MSWWFEDREESGFREGYIEPLIEVRETEKEIVVRADLPFVKDKDGVKVEVSGDELEISAAMGRAIKWEKWGVHQRRQSYTQYRTRIRLPTEVDVGSARATFRDGVLTVSLPKKVTKVRIGIE